MRKNLLGLLFFTLIGVFSNQAWAQENQVTITLDYNLSGVEYTGYQGHRTCTYHSVINNSIKNLNYLHGLKTETTGEVAPNSTCAFRIRNIDAPPAGKTWDDVVVTFNGGEPIEYVYTNVDKGTYCFFFNSGDTGGTLTIKWADTGAIGDVDADSKVVYYADGVVYNNAGEVAIYNVTGKLVLLTSENIVDTQNLANGIYIVRSAKGAVKFVK